MMPRYPKQPLEERLAWMREKQKQKTEVEARPAPVAPVIVQPPQVTTGRQMLRVKKVADMLSVSHMTVRRWFAKRAVIAHPGARRTTMLIPVEALDEWIREHGPPSSR
jgi:excisionase family DNA binding protein